MQLISKPVNTTVGIIFDLVIKRLIVYWVGSGTGAEALEATTDKLLLKHHSEKKQHLSFRKNLSG